MNVASKLSNYSSDTFWGFGCGDEGSVGLFLGLWALFPRWLGKLVRAGGRSLFPSYYAVAFLGTTRPEESENLNLDFPHNRGEKNKGKRGEEIRFYCGENGHAIKKGVK